MQVRRAANDSAQYGRNIIVPEGSCNTNTPRRWSPTLLLLWLVAPYGLFAAVPPVSVPAVLEPTSTEKQEALPCRTSVLPLQTRLGAAFCRTQKNVARILGEANANANGRSDAVPNIAREDLYVSHAVLGYEATLGAGSFASATEDRDSGSSLATVRDMLRALSAELEQFGVANKTNMNNEKSTSKSILEDALAALLPMVPVMDRSRSAELPIAQSFSHLSEVFRSEFADARASQRKLSTELEAKKAELKRVRSYLASSVYGTHLFLRQKWFPKDVEAIKRAQYTQCMAVVDVMEKLKEKYNKPQEDATEGLEAAAAEGREGGGRNNKGLRQKERDEGLSVSFCEKNKKEYGLMQGSSSHSKSEASGNRKSITPPAGSDDDEQEAAHKALANLRKASIIEEVYLTQAVCEGLAKASEEEEGEGTAEDAVGRGEQGDAAMNKDGTPAPAGNKSGLVTVELITKHLDRLHRECGKFSEEWKAHFPTRDPFEWNAEKAENLEKEIAKLQEAEVEVKGKMKKLAVVEADGQGVAGAGAAVGHAGATAAEGFSPLKIALQPYILKYAGVGELLKEMAQNQERGSSQSGWKEQLPKLPDLHEREVRTSNSLNLVSRVYKNAHFPRGQLDTSQERVIPQPAAQVFLKFLQQRAKLQSFIQTHGQKILEGRALSGNVGADVNLAVGEAVDLGLDVMSAVSGFGLLAQWGPGVLDKVGRDVELAGARAGPESGGATIAEPVAEELEKSFSGGGTMLPSFNYSSEGVIGNVAFKARLWSEGMSQQARREFATASLSKQRKVSGARSDENDFSFHEDVILRDLASVPFSNMYLRAEKWAESDVAVAKKKKQPSFAAQLLKNAGTGMKAAVQSLNPAAPYAGIGKKIFSEVATGQLTGSIVNAVKYYQEQQALPDLSEAQKRVVEERRKLQGKNEFSLSPAARNALRVVEQALGGLSGNGDSAFRENLIAGVAAMKPEELLARANQSWWLLQKGFELCLHRHLGATSSSSATGEDDEKLMDFVPTGDRDADMESFLNLRQDRRRAEIVAELESQHGTDVKFAKHFRGNTELASKLKNVVTSASGGGVGVGPSSKATARSSLQGRMDAARKIRDPHENYGSGVSGGTSCNAASENPISDKVLFSEDELNTVVVALDELFVPVDLHGRNGDEQEDVATAMFLNNGGNGRWTSSGLMSCSVTSSFSYTSEVGASNLLEHAVSPVDTGPDAEILCRTYARVAGGLLKKHKQETFSFDNVEKARIAEENVAAYRRDRSSQEESTLRLLRKFRFSRIAVDEGAVAVDAVVSAASPEEGTEETSGRDENEVLFNSISSSSTSPMGTVFANSTGRDGTRHRFLNTSATSPRHITDFKDKDEMEAHVLSFFFDRGNHGEAKDEASRSQQLDALRHAFRKWLSSIRYFGEWANVARQFAAKKIEEDTALQLTDISGSEKARRSDSPYIRVIDGLGDGFVRVDDLFLLLVRNLVKDRVRHFVEKERKREAGTSEPKNLLGRAVDVEEEEEARQRAVSDLPGHLLTGDAASARWRRLERVLVDALTLPGECQASARWFLEPARGGEQHEDWDWLTRNASTMYLSLFQSDETSTLWEVQVEVGTSVISSSATLPVVTGAATGRTSASTTTLTPTSSGRFFDTVLEDLKRINERVIRGKLLSPQWHEYIQYVISEHRKAGYLVKAQGAGKEGRPKIFVAFQHHRHRQEGKKYVPPGGAESTNTSGSSFSTTGTSMAFFELRAYAEARAGEKNNDEEVLKMKNFEDELLALKRAELLEDELKEFQIQLQNDLHQLDKHLKGRDEVAKAEDEMNFERLYVDYQIAAWTVGKRVAGWAPPASEEAADAEDQLGRELVVAEADRTVAEAFKRPTSGSAGDVFFTDNLLPKMKVAVNLGVQEMEVRDMTTTPSSLSTRFKGLEQLVTLLAVEAFRGIGESSRSSGHEALLRAKLRLRETEQKQERMQVFSGSGAPPPGSSSSSEGSATEQNSIDDQDHADSLLLELADAERQVDPYKEGWVWPYANRPDGSTLEDASLNRSIDAIMRKVWDWEREREREQDEEAGRAEMADTDGRDVTMLEAAVKFVNEEFALDVDAAFLQRATLIDLRKGATGPRTATETEGVITPKDLQSKRNPSRHIILLRPRSPAGPHFYVLMANFKQHPFLQQQVLYARHHSLLTTPEETADVISRDQALSQFEKAVSHRIAGNMAYNRVLEMGRNFHGARVRTSMLIGDDDAVTTSRQPPGSLAAARPRLLVPIADLAVKLTAFVEGARRNGESAPPAASPATASENASDAAQRLHELRDLVCKEQVKAVPTPRRRIARKSPPPPPSAPPAVHAIWEWHANTDLHLVATEVQQESLSTSDYFMKVPFQQSFCELFAGNEHHVDAASASRSLNVQNFVPKVKQEMLAPLNDLLTLFHESVTLTKTAFQPSRSMKNGAYVSREKLFSGVKAAEERQQLDGLGSDYSNLGKLALDVLTARSDRAGGRGGSGESISILERLVLSWAVRHDGVNKKTKKQERDQGKPKPSPFRAIDGSRWSVRTVPQQSIPGGATRPAEVMPEVSTVVGALGAASTPAASGDESAAATLLAQTEKVLFDEDCGRDHKSMASAKLETLILVQMKEKDEHEEHFQEPLVSKNAEERSSAVFSGMRDELGSMKSLVDLVVDGDEDDEASNVNKSTTKASRYFPPLLSPQQTRSADFFIALMAEFFARKENPKASSEEEKFFDTYIREEILAAITKVETRGRVWMRKMRFTLIYKERLRLAKAEIEKQRMLQLDTLEQEQRLVQTESERKMWSEVAKFSLWMQMKPESMKRVMLLFLEYQLKAVQKLRSEYMMEAREKLAAVDLTQPRVFLWTHLYKNQRWIPWQGERGEGRAASSSDVAANTWMQPGATAIAGATVEASKTIQGEGMLLGYEDAEAHQWGANGECEGNATQADGNLCETRNDRVVAFGDILSAREILEVVEGIQISGASVTAWQKQMFEAWNTIRKAKDENKAETKPSGYEGGYYAVRAVEGERALLPMFLLTERSERWRAAALLAKLVDSDAAARTEGVAEIASLFMRELLLAQPENQPQNSNGSVEKFRAERHKLLHFLPQLPGTSSADSFEPTRGDADVAAFDSRGHPVSLRDRKVIPDLLAATATATVATAAPVALATPLQQMKDTFESMSLTLSVSGSLLAKLVEEVASKNNVEGTRAVGLVLHWLTTIRKPPDTDVRDGAATAAFRRDTPLVQDHEITPSALVGTDVFAAIDDFQRSVTAKEEEKRDPPEQLFFDEVKSVSGRSCDLEDVTELPLERSFLGNCAHLQRGAKALIADWQEYMRRVLLNAQAGGDEKMEMEDGDGDGRWGKTTGTRTRTATTGKGLIPGGERIAILSGIVEVRLSDFAQLSSGLKDRLVGVDGITTGERIDDQNCASWVLGSFFGKGETEKKRAEDMYKWFRRRDRIAQRGMAIDSEFKNRGRCVVPMSSVDLPTADPRFLGAVENEVGSMSSARRQAANSVAEDVQRMYSSVSAGLESVGVGGRGAQTPELIAFNDDKLNKHYFMLKWGLRLRKTGLGPASAQELKKSFPAPATEIRVTVPTRSDLQIPPEVSEHLFNPQSKSRLEDKTGLVTEEAASLWQATRHSDVRQLPEPGFAKGERVLVLDVEAEAAAKEDGRAVWPVWEGGVIQRCSMKETVEVDTRTTSHYPRTQVIRVRETCSVLVLKKVWGRVEAKPSENTAEEVPAHRIFSPRMNNRLWWRRGKQQQRSQVEIDADVDEHCPAGTDLVEIVDISEDFAIKVRPPTETTNSPTSASSSLSTRTIEDPSVELSPLVDPTLVKSLENDPDFDKKSAPPAQLVDRMREYMHTPEAALEEKRRIVRRSILFLGGRGTAFDITQHTGRRLLSGGAGRGRGANTVEWRVVKGDYLREIEFQLPMSRLEPGDKVTTFPFSRQTLSELVEAGAFGKDRVLQRGSASTAVTGSEVVLQGRSPADQEYITDEIVLVPPGTATTSGPKPEPLPLSQLSCMGGPCAGWANGFSEDAGKLYTSMRLVQGFRLAFLEHGGDRPGAEHERFTPAGADQISAEKFSDRLALRERFRVTEEGQLRNIVFAASLSGEGGRGRAAAKEIATAIETAAKAMHGGQQDESGLLRKVRHWRRMNRQLTVPKEDIPHFLKKLFAQEADIFDNPAINSKTRVALKAWLDDGKVLEKYGEQKTLEKAQLLELSPKRRRKRKKEAPLASLVFTEAERWNAKDRLLPESIDMWLDASKLTVKEAWRLFSLGATRLEVAVGEGEGEGARTEEISFPDGVGVKVNEDNSDWHWMWLLERDDANEAGRTFTAADLNPYEELRRGTDGEAIGRAKKRAEALTADVNDAKDRLEDNSKTWRGKIRIRVTRLDAYARPARTSEEFDTVVTENYTKNIVSSFFASSWIGDQWPNTRIEEARDRIKEHEESYADFRTKFLPSLGRTAGQSKSFSVPEPAAHLKNKHAKVLAAKVRVPLEILPKKVEDENKTYFEIVKNALFAAPDEKAEAKTKAEAATRTYGADLVLPLRDKKDEVTVAITRTYTQKGTNKANFSAAEVFKLLADGRFVESSGEFMALTAEGAETIGAHARVSEKDGGEPEFLGGIHKGDEVLEFDLLVPIAARSSPLRPEIRFGAVSTTADVDANEPRKREAEFRERLSEKITKLQLSPRVLRFLTQPPILHFKSALRNDLYIPSKAPPPLTPDFDEESKEELRKMHDRMAKLREENSDLDEKIDKSRKKELELKTRQENLLKKLAERMASAKVRAARGQFLWNLRRFLSSVESDLFRFEAARAESGNSLLADFRQKILEKHVPRSSSTSTTTSTAVVTTHGDQAPPATLPENVPLAPISTSPCGDYESCWMDWLLQSDAWNWFPFVYRNEGDAHKVRSLRWREETRERVSHKDGVHAVEVTPYQAELLKKKAAAEFPRRGAKNPAQNPNLFSRLPFHLFEGIDPDMVQQILVASVKRYSKRGGAGNVKALTRIKSWKKWYMEEYKPLLHEWLNEREKEYCLKYSLVPTQNVSSVWLGTFFGHPQSMKVLTTERPPAIGGETSKAFPVEDSGGMGIRDSPAPRPAGTAAVDGATEAPDEGKALLYTTQMNKEIQNKVKDQISRLVMDAFFTQDYTEEVSHILHSRLGGARFLEAHFTAGANASKRNVAQQQAATTTNDLRKSNPRARFVVSGALSGPHSSRDTGSSLPHRHIRYSDVLNRLRQETVQKVDAEILEWMRSTCLPQLHSVEADGMRQKVFKVLENVLRGEQMDYEIPGANKQTSTALSLGAAGRATKERSSTCIATQYWVGPMRSPRSSYAPLGSASSSLDEAPASEYRFAFAPKPKDPQNPYEGFFVQAVPTKNADGGESVKLQLQDYFSEGSDNKNDSNYKGSFEDKAQKSFIKRAAEMEEKFRRETALASSSEAAPDAAGAARQDFAENKFWKELERLLLVSGDEPVDISDEGPVQVQPRDVAKHLFGWCFSLSAFPSFMQELLKERTQVFYARNYPVTHAPEHKTKFPGERHRLGVHVLEDPERSPFRLVPHDWSNAGDGATGSDLKVWEGVSQSDSSAYRAASSVTPPARSAGDESMAKEVLEKCVPAYASMIGGGGTAHKIAWNQVDAFGRDTDNFSEKLLHKGGSDGIYVDGKNVRCRSSSRGTEQREKKDDVDEKLLLLNQFGHMALFDALEIELDAIVYELVEEIEVKNAEVFYWDADDRIPGVSVTLAEISSLRVGIPLDTHTNAKSDKSASSGSAPLSGAAAGRAVEGSAMRNYLQHGMPQFLELSDRGNSSGHCTCGVEGDSSVCSGNSEMSSKNLWKHVPLKYMTPWVGSTKCDKGRRDCKQTEENEKQLATNRPENGQNIFVECPEPDPVAAKGALPHAASELGEAVVGNVGVCRAIRDLFKSNSGGKKGCFAHHMLAERYRKTLPDKIRNSTSCPSVRAPTTSTSTTTTTTADEFDLTHFRLLPVSISTAGKRKVDHLQYRLYNYPKLTDFQKRARGMAVEGKPEAPYYVDGTPSAAARTGRGSTSIDEEVPPFRLKRDSSGPVVLRGSKPMAPPGMITVDLTKPRDENEHYLQSLRIRAAPELEEFPVASKESAYADWYKITHVEQDASRLWNYYPFYNFSKRPLMKSSSGGADAAKDKSMQQILQWELEQAGGNLNEAGEATECASGDPKCMNSVQYIRATSGPDKRDTRLRATASAKPGSHGLDGLHGQHAGNLRIRIRHANRYRYSYAEGAISPEGGGPASRTPVDDEKNLSSRCPLLPYFAGRDAVGGVASPESARPLSASGHADESAQKAALAEYTRRRDLIFAAIPAAECDNILEINTSGGSGTGGQIGGFGDNAEPAAQPHGRSGDDVIEGKGTAQDDFHLYMAGSLKATEFFNDIANSNAGAVESGRNKKQELYKDLKERKAAQQEAKNKAKYWPRSFEIEWPAGEGEGGDKNSWLRPPKPCFWELNLAAGAFASLVAWYRVSNPLGAMAAGSALSAALCAAAPHVFAAYLAYQSWTTWSQVRGENFYNMTIGSLGQKAVGGVLDLTASPITRFFGPRFSLLSAAIDAEKHGHSPTDGTRGGYFHDFHVAIVRGEFGSVGATGSAGLPGSAGKPGRGGKAAEFELTIAPRDESSSVPVDVDSESLALFPQSETENNGAQLVIPSLLGAGGSDTPGRDGFDAIRISTAGTWVANNAEENRFQNVLEEVDLEFLAKNFPNAAAGAGQRSTAWSKREDTASLGVWAFSRFSQLGIAVGVPIGLAVAVAHVGIPLTAVAEAVFLTGATIAAIASTVAVSYDALNVLAKDLDTEIEVFVLPETAKTDYAAKTGGPGPGDGGGPTAGALGGGKSTDLLFHDEVAPHIGALRANKWLPLQDAMHNKRRGDQRLAGKRKLANRENRQNVVATERSDSSLATEQQNQADWSSQKQRSSERTSEDDAENEQSTEQSTSVVGDEQQKRTLQDLTSVDALQSTIKNVSADLDRTITSLQEKVSQRSINASAIEQLTEESTQFSEMSRSAQLFGTHAEALSQTEQAIREKSEIGARIGAMSVGNRVLAQLGGTVSAEVASATRRAAEQQRGRARRACVAAAEGLQRVSSEVLAAGTEMSVSARGAGLSAVKSNSRSENQFSEQMQQQEAVSQQAEISAAQDPRTSMRKTAERKRLRRLFEDELAKRKELSRLSKRLSVTAEKVFRDQQQKAFEGPAAWLAELRAIGDHLNPMDGGGDSTNPSSTCPALERAFGGSTATKSLAHSLLLWFGNEVVRPRVLFAAEKEASNLDSSESRPPAHPVFLFAAGKKATNPSAFLSQRNATINPSRFHVHLPDAHRVMAAVEVTSDGEWSEADDLSRTDEEETEASRGSRIPGSSDEDTTAPPKSNTSVASTTATASDEAAAFSSDESESAVRSRLLASPAPATLSASGRGHLRSLLAKLTRKRNGQRQGTGPNREVLSPAPFENAIDHIDMLDEVQLAELSVFLVLKSAAPSFSSRAPLLQTFFTIADKVVPGQQGGATQRPDELRQYYLRQLALMDGVALVATAESLPGSPPRPEPGKKDRCRDAAAFAKSVIFPVSAALENFEAKSTEAAHQASRENGVEKNYSQNTRLVDESFELPHSLEVDDDDEL